MQDLSNADKAIRWSIRSNGYIGAYIGEKKRNGKRANVYQHRWVWERHFGAIPPDYQIHHKDGNKKNNDISNLEIISQITHSKITWMGLKIPATDWDKKEAFTVQCSSCTKNLLRKKKCKAYSCISCSRKKAEKERKKTVICIFCNKVFESRQGKFCSQRCVNLGARWSQA